MNPVEPRRGRSTALVSSGLLLAGGVVVAAGAFLGAAHPFDGSRPGSVHAAVLVVLLPAVVALALVSRRPLLGLAATAGAGVVAVGRLLADVGVVTGANSAVRPELFYESTDRAQPFTAAAGAWVLLAGDVVLVAAGVLAARALADRLAPGTDDTGFGFDEAVSPSDAEVTGPAQLAVDPADPGRNNGLIAAGFAGVLLLLTGSLGLPYSGGYLAARYLPAELGLAGIGSALAVASVATIAVLVAAVLPRRLAAALLGGVALTAVVPPLTAVVVRLASAPVQLTASVWVTAAGAVVLAGAGLLGNAAPVVDDYDVASPSARRRSRWVGAVLSVAAGVAAVLAWRLPQLRYNGGADPVLPGGSAISAPLAAPFLLAGLVPLVAALLLLVPALGAAGRAVATVGWLPLVFAAGQTLALLGQLESSASVPNAGFAAPRWTAGPGLWWAVGGIVAGVAAAEVCAQAARQARDASTQIPQEESLARSRTIGGQVAAALSVVTVVALVLPVYRTAAGSSATLLVGFDVRSWGVLGLGAGMIAAAAAGGRSLRPAGAVGFLLAGAAISVARLVVPASVRSSDGFALGAGWYVGWATTALFVLAAAGIAVTTRRIVLVDADLSIGTARSRPAAGRPTGSGPRSSGERAAGRRPVGKQASAGASSSKAKGRP